MAFRDFGDGYKRNVSALQSRHLVRVAQAAVLPLLVIVPVDRDDG